MCPGSPQAWEVLKRRKRIRARPSWICPSMALLGFNIDAVRPYDQVLAVLKRGRNDISPSSVAHAKERKKEMTSFSGPDLLPWDLGGLDQQKDQGWPLYPFRQQFYYFFARNPSHSLATREIAQLAGTIV